MAQQGSTRPFRPIAPRTLPGPLPPPPAPPGGGVEEVKIRRASAACTECKRRRTKVPIFSFDCLEVILFVIAFTMLLARLASGLLLIPSI